jgi:hypothetical protein
MDSNKNPQASSRHGQVPGGFWVSVLAFPLGFYVKIPEEGGFRHFFNESGVVFLCHMTRALGMRAIFVSSQLGTCGNIGSSFFGRATRKNMTAVMDPSPRQACPLSGYTPGGIDGLNLMSRFPVAGGVSVELIAFTLL